MIKVGKTSRSLRSRFHFDSTLILLRQNLKKCLLATLKTSLPTLSKKNCFSLRSRLQFYSHLTTVEKRSKLGRNRWKNSEKSAKKKQREIWCKIVGLSEILGWLEQRKLYFHPWPRKFITFSRKPSHLLQRGLLFNPILCRL